jgi:predicted nucleotidyltransferase
MTTEQIKEAILGLIDEYHISKVILFGSRANGTNRENSDVDLIIEFSKPVSLLTLSAITCKLDRYAWDNGFRDISYK